MKNLSLFLLLCLLFAACAKDENKEPILVTDIVMPTQTSFNPGDKVTICLLYTSFFGTPDEGYFMTSAAHPEGPWEPLTPLLAEAGWDDCTAMWDDNGKAYFVGTHFADGYKTYLFKMAEDGKSIDRKSAVLINSGSGREASKLIKVNGWYYLIFSEHKPGVGRYVMAKRSRKLTGPYKDCLLYTSRCV